MNKTKQFHKDMIKATVSEMIEKRYVQGDEDHKEDGCLWEKDNLLDEAIEEAIDTVVYLITLREKIENINLPF